MDSRTYTCDDRPVPRPATERIFHMPRPATGRTPVRNVRVAERLWRAAQDKAKAEGRTLTDVIVAYLRRYISTPPRKRADDE